MRKGFYSVEGDNCLSFENTMLDAFIYLQEKLNEGEEGRIIFYKFLNKEETEWEFVSERRYFKKKGHLIKFYVYYVHS